MDYPCGIIQNLIPAYVAGDCTPETEDAVSRHVKQCKACAEFLAQTQRQYWENAQLEKWGVLWTLKQWLESLWENRRKVLKGAGAVLAVCALLACAWGAWWGLTQVDCVPVSPEDYRVVQVLQLEDGDIYCEYQVRYHSTFSQHYVISDGTVYFPAMRPVLDQTYADWSDRDGKWIMDPDSVWDKPNREYISVDAIYLGNPEMPGETVLIWQRDMELPSPSAEKQAEIEAEDWVIY